MIIRVLKVAPIHADTRTDIQAEA